MCNPSTYPSEDSQMLSSLLKSKLGSRSWGNSSSSLSSWSAAVPRLSSTPVMTGMSGSTGWDSRLCWLVETSVSSAPSSLWVELSARASACRNGEGYQWATRGSLPHNTHTHTCILKQVWSCRGQTREHPQINAQSQTSHEQITPPMCLFVIM